MDSSQPNVFVVNEADTGTVAYNWKSGTRTVVSSRPFNVCGPRGLLYANTENGPVRYSLSEPQGRPIAHLPTHVAQDGSLQVYSLAASQLWASQDGGLTWKQVTTPDKAKFESVAACDADARSIYALTSQNPSSNSPPGAGTASGRFYVFSSDAGQTWEMRRAAYQSDPEQTLEDNVVPMPGIAAPCDMVLGVVKFKGDSPVKGGGRIFALSSDGARSFHRVGEYSYGKTTELVYTPGGIVRMYRPSGYDSWMIDRSTDGGVSWQPVERQGLSIHIAAARGVPGSIFQ